MNVKAAKKVVRVNENKQRRWDTGQISQQAFLIEKMPLWMKPQATFLKILLDLTKQH